MKFQWQFYRKFSKERHTDENQVKPYPSVKNLLTSNNVGYEVASTMDSALAKLKV